MSHLTAPQYVVIHTAGTPGGNFDISASAIRDYHTTPVSKGGKGWADIGYHWVVRQTGHIEKGRDESVMGAQVEGFNHLSLGVCFSGNGDLADFTPQQKEAGAEHVAEILVRHGLVEKFLANPMHVLGHHETVQLVDAGVFPGPKTPKTCPGTKVSCTEFRNLVLARLKSRGHG